jgi:4-amino-4-deoxy-L-arabinose transferase-like glycosyltransferase
MDSAAKLRRWERWMLVALLLVGAALRLVALGDVPPGPGYDELENVRLSERILAGEWAIYFPDNFGQESLYPTLAALAVRLLGWSVPVLRLPGALAGVLSVLALYLAGRRLAGQRAALVAAAFQAISFWPLLETRMALEMTLLPPLVGLAMLFLARGLGGAASHRWHSLLDFALAGGFLGVQVYAYTAGRVMVLLPLALLVYLVLLDRRTLRRYWSGVLLLCLVTVLVAGPLALFLRAHPGAEQRLDQLSGPLTALRQGDFRPALKITAGTLGMFALRGEPQWLYNIAYRPVFDPITAVFFFTGLVLCIAQLRDWRCGATLLWLLVGLGPAMVSLPPGSFNHTLAAQPAVYLVLALGVDAAWKWLARRRAWAGPLLVSFLFTLNAVLSGHAYFVTWARAPEVRELYQGGITAVAHELDVHDPPGPVAVGAPYVSFWHPWNAVGFDLALRRDDLRVRWFNPAGGWVWPAGSGSITYYFPTDPLGPQTLDPALEELFIADATLLPAAGDGFTAFRVASPAALEERLGALPEPAVAWPPELAHLSPPTLPLVFGDRLALLGTELGERTVSPGGELRLITYWDVVDAEPTPVVAFVHLTADGHDIWGQHDWLDVRAEDLRPGDRFAQVHRVPVNPETPPGIYHVQLGLYRPDTLQRLPIAAGAGATADRVWVGEVYLPESCGGALACRMAASWEGVCAARPVLKLSGR